MLRRKTLVNINQFLNFFAVENMMECVDVPIYPRSMFLIEKLP